jgi:hypothetical protein
LAKRQREQFEKVMLSDNDSEPEPGSVKKRVKRTIEDTPQKPDANMIYRSGSEEEYVPGRKLNKAD